MSEPNPPHVDDAPLALCLSGGGLRATLFHLGVIQSLRATRRGERSALESVGEIYSVSGGSILAAHLVLNWDKYCGTEDEFQSMAKQIRALAHRDMRNRVVRRWVGSLLLVLPRLIWRRGRTYWLTREYESLYGKARLLDLRTTDGRPRPALHILATSFRTGDMCSFSASGFEISLPPQHGREPSLIQAPAEMIEVALAVASSSAFPPFFPPIRLTHRMLGQPEHAELQGFTDLSDGGVFDNLGAEKLIFDKNIGRSRARTVVLSNAGASLQTELRTSLWGIVSRNVRASDIMMRRVADSTDHKITQSADIEVIDIRIRNLVDNPGLPKATQDKLKRVRTDLDRFGPMLADILIAHGFGAGIHELKKVAGFDAGTAGPEKSKATVAQLDREAEYAAQRFMLKVDWSDWTTHALAALVLALSTFMFWSASTNWIAYRISLSKLEIAEQQQRENHANEYAARLKAENQLGPLLAENEELKRKLKALGEQVLPPGFENADYQVWTQFAGTLKRSEMVTLGGSILKLWPNAPGAERGGERTGVAAGYREVRYGVPEDRPAALRLTADIDATGLFAPMTLPKLTPGIPPRSLEIWVSR